MMVDASFIMVLLAAFAGLLASVAIERIMTPVPPLVRPWGAWMVHGGLWLLLFSCFTLLLGRPWFASASVSATFLMLVLVNNAKMQALHEPFVFQDYEYFTDMIRHPRLYIPFMGWWKFLGAAAGFILAICVGLWGESVPELRFSPAGQLGAVVFLIVTSLLLLRFGTFRILKVIFEPARDLHLLGFLASLLRYGQEEKIAPEAASPFRKRVLQKQGRGLLPHLIAVQSESFFDPRPLYKGIRADILQEFDRLQRDGVAHGKLSVPAWGANTVRSEFAFLTGIEAGTLGVHRFNPYRAVAGGWEVGSIAEFLANSGYRTICVHPYPMSFYRRDRVFPRLGFGEFMDIRSFAGMERFGPYVSDLSVAERISGIIGEATTPVFIFVITMENHGPLHLEKISPLDFDTLYNDGPPLGCEDLTIYLRHIRNADRMIKKLRQTLEQCDMPASLCWYGDHVPIMPEVYSVFEVPDGNTEYCIWNNMGIGAGKTENIDARYLSVEWVRLNGLY